MRAIAYPTLANGEPGWGTRRFVAKKDAQLTQQMQSFAHEFVVEFKDENSSTAAVGTGCDQGLYSEVINANPVVMQFH